MKAEEKLRKARVKIQEKSPFFGYLSIHLNLVKDNKGKYCEGRMGVDKAGNLYYSEKYVNKISEDERIALVMHEVLHVAFRHFFRKGSKNLYIFNVAADIAVNDILHNSKYGNLDTTGYIPIGHEITILENTSKEFKIKNINEKNVEMIYDELMSKFPKFKGKFKIVSGGHKCKAGENKIIIRKSPDNHIYKGKDFKKGKKNDEKIQKKWKKKLIRASQEARVRGKLPAGIQRKIDKSLEVYLNWRNLLKKYITNDIISDYTYTVPAKKSRALGIYFPKIERKNIEIGVIIDTSGSIGDKQLSQFVGVLEGLERSFRYITINCVIGDAKVQNVVEFKPGINLGNKIKNLKLKGGGGTDMPKLAEWFEENKQNTKLVITVTDGYTPITENKRWDQIWCITERGKTLDFLPDYIRGIKLRNE